jgi:hypothetical protein
VTSLLDSFAGEPYGQRDEARFLGELNALTRQHLAGCEGYGRMWPGLGDAQRIEDAPYVHVGVFKHINLRTESEGIEHQRTLESSSTSGMGASQITLDARSSGLQGRSSEAILASFVGQGKRPLLILDSVKSLRRRGGVSARVAAAMSLQPFSDSMHFMLGDPNDGESMKWEALGKLLAEHDELLVYGFTWILWLAWGAQVQSGMPDEIRAALKNKRIHFVHSGGWKKLEAAKVEREQLDELLLRDLHADSAVIDYYGLVEQVGVVYPLCSEGWRHVPVWADVLVRDPLSLQSLETEPGQLQLINLLAHGAPYHSVLTEDMGRMLPGECACGRGSRRFELIGRVPKAELRGCANV